MSSSPQQRESRLRFQTQHFPSKTRLSLEQCSQHVLASPPDHPRGCAFLCPRRNGSKYSVGHELSRSQRQKGMVYVPDISV